MSITCIGFTVNHNGDVLDPVTNEIIQPASLSPQLFTRLKQNGLNLNENCHLWDRKSMIKKIGMVMGLESVNDPDPSYVLTVGNIIKMFAIQMRFRCIMAIACSELHALTHLISTQVQHPSGGYGRDRLWQDPPHPIHV